MRDRRPPTTLVLMMSFAACMIMACFLTGCGEESTRPPANGVLYVGSLPGRALIYIDARSTAKLTPDTLSVKAGDHTLTLALEGYRDSTVTFSLGENDTLRFDIRLDPLEGTLTWASIPGVDATIFAIDFATLNYGCAVGENGRVFRTIDSGLSWVEVASGTNENLLGVSFPSPSAGWACGTNGVILRSTDYGETWDSLPSGVTADLHDIFFVDVTKGWAVGESGTILRTTNGGLSWTVEPSGTSMNLSAVYFFSTTVGWAVGGYLPGEGQVILRTTNGGVSWSTRPSVSNSCLRDILFVSSSLGLCVGDDGLILRSTDGGLFWSSVGNVAPVPLRSLASWSNVDLWVVGGEFGSSGQVLRSSDGGIVWFPFEETPQSLLCVDAIQGWESGWAGGEGGLWGYR